MRVLVMTAVSVEREAVLRGLQNDRRFDVLIAGVGPVAAAANTAKVLATSEYGLVVTAGIGGGPHGVSKRLWTFWKQLAQYYLANSL